MTKKADKRLRIALELDKLCKQNGKSSTMYAVLFNRYSETHLRYMLESEKQIISYVGD